MSTPSRMKLLVCSRLPFTCGRDPEPWKRATVFIAPGEVDTAPGMSSVNEAKLRPLSGMLVSLLEDKVSPVAWLSVCSNCPTSVTSTTWVISPISSFKSIRAIWLASTLKGPTTDFLKPLDSAVMV